ncbi:PLP-dependent aminotransferase family protein [Agaribacter marinus]|uniref:HTH gntR-type domain-containing protein n=1 Tax=Agaribacter marinus TaxID=1431249 RepID=A0AA37WL58_9ALTE|nr:PLP-dependent aminotransferase family protein [Agaribacter marinus]GLR72109.1 hypothetical protein GCM10007852_30170 [Agaribacter marinus]
MSNFKYEYIIKELSEKISRKEWHVGERIPSIRQLSREFSAAKVTVQTALQKMEASHILYSKARSGYYVEGEYQNNSQTLHYETIRTSIPRPVKVPEIFYDIMAKSAAFDIFPSGEDSTQSSTHLDLLNRHIGRAMRCNSKAKADYYAMPEGSFELRKQLAYIYKQIAIDITPENICLTNGCQNSLYLTLSACCNEGDTVAVESPAFYGVLQILQQLKLNVVEINASATQGISAIDVKAVCDKWQISACVISANFATPTGALMPREEKIAIAELAATHNFTIIEDDIYGDLGFDYRPEPIRSFDRHDNTIICSSFSKSLSRDIRTGWIVCNDKYKEKILRIKLLNQLASPISVHEGIATFLSEGHYKRHLINLRKTLKQQLNSMLDLIHANWQFQYDYRVPNGGLCIWVELSRRIDTLSLYHEAMTQGIVITPGRLFSNSKRFDHHIRLSFAHAYTFKRKDALLTLGKMCKQRSPI